MQHAKHLQLLVLYGANLDEHPEIAYAYDRVDYGACYNPCQAIRQTINDFAVGTPGAALRTAMAQGLAARRHLVVLILGARVAPALSQDTVQLICQYACL